MLRSLLWIAGICALIYLGATVKLGKHTTFGHLKRIWSSHETQDLVHGVEEKAAPSLDKMKHAVQEGDDRASNTEPVK